MRQYIGARYMPKFMGTYDATTAYEALSVVDNGMGTSYVANQPVPAGTPLSNTTYWAVYGASSGAIINLQDQVDEINNLLHNKRFVIIADSFGQLPGGNTFINKLQSYFGLNASDLFSSVEGGAGYSVAGNLGHTFSDLIDNISVTDPETITHFIIMGGINDTNELNNTDNFETGITSVINKAKALCPNAQIIACYNCDYVYGFVRF